MMFHSPWSAVNKSNRNKRGRGRLARSCDSCYAKKIRCDAAKPRCDWCYHHDQPCTFVRGLESAQGVRATSTSDVYLEPDSNWSGTLSSSCPPSPMGNSGDIGSFAQNLQFAGRHLGNICTFNGMPVLSKSGVEWVKSCTGEEFRLDRFPADIPGWQLSRPRDSNEQTFSLHTGLPDLALFLQEIKEYQSTAFGIMFPIIDISLVQSTIGTAYYQQISDGSLGIMSARACVLAFHALALLIIPRQTKSSSSPAIDYFREAYRLLPDVLLETVTIDGLQAILSLCLCAQGLAGEIYTIDYLLSTASRFVFYLKGNISPYMAWEVPSAINFHTRHLFWITYVCDKGFSLVSGLAPRIEESQCDLEFSSLPKNEIFEDNNAPHINGDPMPGSYLRSYVLLSFVQSRIYRELYTPSAMKRSDAELLERIRDLDCALEDWRNSLPLSNRPSLVTPQTSKSTYSHPQSFDMRTSVFHLQYHHCIIMIHQASSRCKSWVQNQDTHGTGSSLAMSVAASRCLLGGFLYCSFQLDSQNVLFTLSYFMQASIIIFCQSLSQPLDNATHKSQGSLILLGEISDRVKNCVSASDPACYTAKIQFASEVIKELERLAHCRFTRNDSGMVNS